MFPRDNKKLSQRRAPFPADWLQRLVSRAKVFVSLHVPYLSFVAGLVAEFVRYHL